MWQSILIIRAKIILIFSWPKQTVYFGNFQPICCQLSRDWLMAIHTSYKKIMCVWVRAELRQRLG